MKNMLFTIVMLTFVSVLFAQDGEFHLDKEYKISKTGTIELGASDAKVFITGSGRATAHVKIDRKVTAKGWSSGNQNFRVEIEENNGDLKIREKRSGNGIAVVGYYHDDYKIEIEAPEGASLTVKGDDGDYYIKNVNGSIFLSLDDADAELSDCKGSKFRFKMDDGDIRMNTGRGSLEIKGDDSDVQIYHAQFTEIDADVDDGDLVIETSLSDKGNYRVNAQDGLVSFNITGGGGEFDIHHDDGNILTQGNFKTIEESEKHSVVTLASGSAKVLIQADDARIKLSGPNN
jgi:hypothetical protein